MTRVEHLIDRVACMYRFLSYFMRNSLYSALLVYSIEFIIDKLRNAIILVFSGSNALYLRSLQTDAKLRQHQE